MCISVFLGFLVRFMCSQKSCSLLFFVVSSLLCLCTLLFFLSLPLSLCFLSLGEERAINVPCGPPSFSHKGGAEKPDMHVTRSERVSSPQLEGQRPFGNQPCAGGNGGRPPSLFHCLGLTKRDHLFPPTLIATPTYLLCWIGLPTLLLHTHSHSSLYSLSNRKSLLLPLITHTASRGLRGRRDKADTPRPPAALRQAS